ncbi:peptidase M61 [Brevundimonas sp. LM2]|uniref:M61 family metallopeptidase n=1 Tax=Brevundimonas sp. LM2 TaxID=1938605 RepID=UPI000983AC35|nr:M61 family metallopeptidase [Brevundimonas sp. LM2]AQR61547.1 peptidase M61 [Brevundimonas sp. LM2]
MSRLFATACAAALLISVGAVSAQTPQTGPGPTTPDIGGFPDSPPIPAPSQATYPGTIGYEVDATDLDRRIVSVRQTIPVQPGPLTLLYPKYLPGNHADSGPIQLLAGLTITADGRRVEWRRDAVDPYAFHLDVPAGTTQIEAAFQWLTQSDNANWRVVMTPSMMNLQFEKALLYPAGYAATGITFAPSVRLPQGWQYGVALETASFENGLATFAPVSLYTLVDSPMFAGAHYRRIDIDPTGEDVHLNIVADEADNLAPTAEQLGHYEAMVTQADRLFGSRHYDRYEFLLGLTNQMGGIGLEHHRSSENTHAPDFFTAWGKSAGSRALLPHEYAHSWNGKFRRPADELTANYNVPTENSLLWVYEGQTEYWGDVLSARSGLHTKAQALILLADRAAFYQNQPGRQWRNLQDANNHNLLGYRVPGQWTSWMRGTSDYYDEAALIWLDADTLIRERTNDRRSLDDFARAFFSPESTDGDWSPHGYTFADVVAALNAVAPHDWATFLRDRLDAVGPDATAPLDGLARGGYRLTYVEEPNADEKAVHSNWGSDFRYSLGFSLSGPNQRITAIQWGGPAYAAGIGAGWDLIAVGDQAATPEVLRDAVTAAKDGTTPIRLTLKSGTRIRTLDLPWTEGLRYPRLERVEGTRDRIGDIMTARRR